MTGATPMATNGSSRNPAYRVAPQGLPLASLTDCALQDRFYSWLGLSGTKYVCTVFAILDASAIGEFSDAAVIGVARHDGVRRPVCVLQPSDFTRFASHPFVQAAIKLGVNEWHVHFSADHRKLAEDLAAA